MKKSIYIISVLCAAAIFCVSCVSTPSEEPAQDVVSESESLQQDVLPPEQGAAGNQVVSDAAGDNFLEENVPSEEEDNQEKEEPPASSLPALSDDKPVINLSVGVGPSGVTRSGTNASSLGKEKNISEQKKSLSTGTSQNRTAALSSADASDESAAADVSGANSSGVQNETDMTDDISAELVLEEAPGDFDIVYDEPEVVSVPEEMADEDEINKRDTAIAEAADAKDESAVDEIATVPEEIAAGNESDRRDTAVAEAADAKEGSAVDEASAEPEEIAAGNESDRRDTAVAEAADAKDESAADEAAAEPQELAVGEDTERDTAVAAVVIPEVIDPDEAVIDETDSLAESEMEDNILFDEPSVVVVSSEEENSDVRNVDFSSEGEQKNSDPVISRSVEMQLGQSLELVYPGQGWIYIGELDTAQPLLSYSGCEKKYRDTVFTLTSQRTGTSLLQFVKKDILADAYIRDYLEVIVSGPYDDDISTTLVTAPSYAEIIPANQDYVLKAHRRQNSAILVGSENRGVYYNTPEVDVKSKIDTSEGDGVPAGAAVPQEPQKIGVDRDDVQEALTAEPGSIVQQENTEESSAQPSVSDFFAQAQQAYNSKDYETAASCINSFIKNSTQRLDEALYLKGLIFEAKSGIQNVKIALSAYKAVVNGWPESSVWNSANERAIYLERFYFNIR